MEPSFLKQIINVDPQISSEDADSAPYSYIEWKRRLPSIIDSDAPEHYNTYVLKWFAKNTSKPVSKKFLLRQKYLYLLDQLQMFFSTEEKNTWYEQINLADERELLHAIPYFAKKLKDISVYYLNLRKRLKNAKSDYNAGGSAKGIVDEVYRYFLDVVAAKDNERSPLLQSILPNLSQLQNSLTVNIQELYDDHQYFDVSPTNSLSNYFNLLDDVTSKYFATKGIVLSSADWLFRSLDVPVTSDNFTSFITQITGSVFETADAELYTEFVQKYLAENKHLIQVVPEVSSVVTYNFDVPQGNSFFYYPYGTESSTFSFKTQLPTIALSSTYIGPATAGTSLEDSDTLIVKYGKETKAAWLRYLEYVDLPRTVNAIIKKDTTTSFIYPFPGYGLSASESAWTGPSFSSNPEYNFLNIGLKAQVNEAYWSQTLPNDTCNAILLNNTTMISTGAIAHKNPQFADQVYLRSGRITDTTAPRTELSGAWLYKFDRTALPVSNVNENVFLWPYCRVDGTADFPEFYSKINFKKACNPVSVQNILNSYFVASSSIDTADKIYKLTNWTDPVIDAVECAWLSGSITETADFNTFLQTGIQTLTAGGVNGYRYVNQDGFSAEFPAGEMVRFIWTGPNQTRLSEVFKSISHRSDCPFATNIPAVAPLEWEKCSCKQVYHTPFGHGEDSFAEGNYLADCIFRVPEQDLSDYDFGSFKDTKKRDLILSQDEFAWYYTQKGWGGGYWRADSIRGQSNPFTLRTGRAYIYRRAKHPIDGTSMPFYAVNYNFLLPSRTKWIQARKNSDNDWIALSGESTMKFFPGDFIRVDRRPTTTHVLLSSVIIENVNENTGSVWSTYDKLVYKCDEQVYTTISWPDAQAEFGAVDFGQYPPVSLGQLSSIDAWSIHEYEGRRDPVDGRVMPASSQFIAGVNVITFIPPAPGTYFVALTATVRPEWGGYRIYLNRRKFNSITKQWEHDPYPNLRPPVNTTGPTRFPGVLSGINFPGDLDIDNVIPDIKVVEETSGTDLAKLSFTTKTAGFLIEQTLKGWNYNRRTVDEYGSGARPYWAELELGKNSTTRFKGVYSWGYPDDYIDGYLPNYNPRISPLEIQYGNILEYSRKGESFNWQQPITYKQFSGTTQWCLLSTDITKTSNLSSLYFIKKNVEPIAAPNHAPSDILLSNFVDGAPLEIYYYALNAFEWSVSYTETKQGPTPALSSYFIANAPWSNFSNRFYPTIANVPTAESLYTIENKGGYFLPQNLGVSQFINRNFDVFIKPEYGLSATTVLAESVDVHIGGRGLTKEDQHTIFEWKENNQWLKESSTAGELAGYVKKSLTKNLQTFIPYQSNIQETSLGLVTTRSRYTPWGGLNDEEWVDKSNEPRGFTGVVNVSAWADSQVLKQNEHVVDSWASDIYGNQYGLYKPYDVNLISTEQANMFGQLWVRTNDQKVLPATKALSSVYAPFQGLITKDKDGWSAEIYSDLILDHILYINCYFDTLFIKTPSAAIFAKILFNYETKSIEMVFDDARWLVLNEQFRHEQNWFFSTEKKIVSLYTDIRDTKEFYLKLYELDLLTRRHRLIYQTEKLTNPSFYFNSLSRASLHYNKELNTFLVTYMGTDINGKQFVLDYYLKRDQEIKLIKSQLYTDLSTQNIESYPPVVLTQYLSTVDVGTGPFVFAVSATNNPSYYRLLNYNSLITVDNSGTFVGNLSAGVHYINYVVGNEGGEVKYGLTLNVYNPYKAQVAVTIKPQRGTVFANVDDGSVEFTFQGTLSSFKVLYGSQIYTTVPGGTIIVENLHTGLHEFIVQDDYFGKRPLNIIVGYTGYRDSNVYHLAVESKTVLGYPLNTLFDI